MDCSTQECIHLYRRSAGKSVSNDHISLHDYGQLEASFDKLELLVDNICEFFHTKENHLVAQWNLLSLKPYLCLAQTFFFVSHFFPL